MKNQIKSIVGVLAMLVLFFAVGCKDTPPELAETRLDVRSGSVSARVHLMDGSIEKFQLRGDMEYRNYTVDVGMIVVVSLEDGTSARVNGRIVEPMNEGDSFEYYPNEDKLDKWKPVKTKE